MELQERLGELRAQGLGVAAISYDSQEVLAAFAERKGVADVPLLSDDDSSAIRAFGIYNHVAEEGIGPNRETRTSRPTWRSTSRSSGPTR